MHPLLAVIGWWPTARALQGGRAGGYSRSGEHSEAREGDASAAADDCLVLSLGVERSASPAKPLDRAKRGEPPTLLVLGTQERGDPRVSVGAGPGHAACYSSRELSMAV